jgi:hypothetical protein
VPSTAFQEILTSAKLAGDLEMQNMSAEIRIRAERRAGQLLSDMEKNPSIERNFQTTIYNHVLEQKDA